MSGLQPQESLAAGSWPSVSIIVPMRNEEKYIEGCLAAIFAQDYPGDVEVLVVDGMSEDCSRSIVLRLADAFPRLRLLENPQRTTPAAMNAGIRHAAGDIIVRVDARTILERDYVRRCVECLRRTGASSAGGRQRAISESYLGKAIALTVSSPLAVGDSKFHYAQEAGEVDTVYLGAFPREIFDQVGYFNETLVRNQDYEFNYRIRQAGLTVYMDPAIKSWYLNRGSLRDFWRQYFQYGFWKVEMLSFYPRSVRWRQLAPPILVAGLTTTALLGRWSRPLAAMFRLIVVAYTSLAGVFTLRTAIAHGWRYLPVLPAVFASTHLSWGLGFLWGLICLPRRLRGRRSDDQHAS